MPGSVIPFLKIGWLNVATAGAVGTEPPFGFLSNGPPAGFPNSDGMFFNGPIAEAINRGVYTFLDMNMNAGYDGSALTFVIEISDTPGSGEGQGDFSAGASQANGGYFSSLTNSGAWPAPGQTYTTYPITTIGLPTLTPTRVTFTISPTAIGEGIVLSPPFHDDLDQLITSAPANDAILIDYIQNPGNAGFFTFVGDVQGFGTPGYIGGPQPSHISGPFGAPGGASIAAGGAWSLAILGSGATGATSRKRISGLWIDKATAPHNIPIVPGFGPMPTPPNTPQTAPPFPPVAPIGLAGGGSGGAFPLPQTLPCIPCCASCCACLTET